MSEERPRWWWCHAHRRAEREDAACPGAAGAPRLSPVELLVRHDHLPRPAQSGPGRWWYSPHLDEYLDEAQVAEVVKTGKNPLRDQ